MMTLVLANANKELCLKKATCKNKIGFFNQQKAQTLLFQMWYDSLPNSEKLPSDSLRAEALHVFTSLLLFSFLLELCQPCHSTFWSVTQSMLVGYQATISPFEKDTQSFYMAPIGIIYLVK